MKRKTPTEISTVELRYLLNAIETIEAEIEQLQFDNTWFVSDCIDYVVGSKQILHSLLGIEDIKYEEEDID